VRDFEVHEPVDGWVGQAVDLKDALRIREELIAQGYAEAYITAKVDEEDLPS